MADWRLMREVMVHLIYLTDRLFFTSWVTCCRYLSGTQRRIQQRFKPENYTWSAHVQDIVYRHKFDVALEPAAARNFILVHNRFDHPDIVLRDNITLYNITETEAIFVEYAEGLDITLMDTAGFVGIGQFIHARRTIEIPIESFHKLARQVGDPAGELVLISNTARCGSTLMNQFFEETGQCQCYSEPDPLNVLSVWMDVKPESFLQETLRSCVRLLFKPRTDRPYQANVIKIRSLTIREAELFTSTYPNTRHILVYRDGAPTVRSIIRITVEVILLFKLAIASANICKPLSKIVFIWMVMPFEEPEWYEPGSIHMKCSLAWAVCCKHYLKFRKQGMNVAGIRYEDFLEDPLKAGKAMLKHLKLPEEWAAKGINALNKDSQRKSPVNRDALGRVVVPELTTEDLAWIEEMCRRYELPSITEKCVLKNTISD